MQVKIIFYVSLSDFYDISCIEFGLVKIKNLYLGISVKLRNIA